MPKSFTAPTSMVLDVINILADYDWANQTLTMPQNGDRLTLIPHFRDESKPSKDNFIYLEVQGSILPISGTPEYVLYQLYNYQHVIDAYNAMQLIMNEYGLASVPAFVQE